MITSPHPELLWNNMGYYLEVKIHKKMFGVLKKISKQLSLFLATALTEYLCYMSNIDIKLY